MISYKVKPGQFRRYPSKGSLGHETREKKKSGRKISFEFLRKRKYR
jgi:hypothetical protein